MKVIYDRKKAEWLLKERNINMKEIEKQLLDEGFIKVIKNNARPGQRIFILSYKGYIHAVLFIVDEEGKHVLKTAYAIRKYNKIFGGRNENKL